MQLAWANMALRLGYLAVTTGLLAGACSAGAPVGIDPGEASSGDSKADGVVSLPDVRCDDAPDAGPHKSWRHSFKSSVITAVGDAHHRGIDLVAAASADTQDIIGEISYGLVDKALEDEDVDVFACRAGTWKRLGTTRTDGEGHFRISLEGSDRLPLGMRDMFVSVAGDRSSARFLAIVAPDDAELAVSDVDGTLTTSESAYIPEVSTDPDIQPGAAAAWKRVTATGAIPVYVTARARTFTDDTRDWLAEKDMPRGALRLAPHLLLPGSATADYKASTFDALQTQLPIVLGVGNRASDIDAYARAGLASDHIYVKLSEFLDELRDRLANGDAIGLDSYDELLPF